MMKGIFGSDHTGWTNFTKLFADPAFRNVLSNTLAIKMEYIGGADPVILQYGAVLCLPTILLLLLFRRWLTSEVFVSQIRKL